MRTLCCWKAYSYRNFSCSLFCPAKEKKRKEKIFSWCKMRRNFPKHKSCLWLSIISHKNFSLKPLKCLKSHSSWAEQGKYLLFDNPMMNTSFLKNCDFYAVLIWHNWFLSMESPKYKCLCYNPHSINDQTDNIKYGIQ